MTVTASSVNRLFSRVRDFTDAPKLGGGKTLWVDATSLGDNPSAQPYRQELPYATIKQAELFALAGDTIRIRSGFTNENAIGKDGIKYHFEAGTGVAYSAVVSSATQVKGIFDDSGGAMTFEVTGFGTFTMNLTESSNGAAGGQSVWALRLTAASNVKIAGRSLSCTTSFRVGGFPLNTGRSISQTAAATFLCEVDDPGTATIGAGSARFITKGTNATITAAGGTVDVAGPTPAALTCSSGTLRADFHTLTSAAISGGTARFRGHRLDSLNHSGGDCYADVFNIGAISRTGSSGTAHYGVRALSNGDNEGINVSQSGTAKTYAAIGVLESTHSPVATFAGGVMDITIDRVRESGPTGTHGTDIAIGLGDVAGVNATDLTLRIGTAKVSDSTHSVLRIYSEDPGPSVYRINAGEYQAGATGFWIDPEAAANVNVQNIVTANRPAGPFATLVGAGTVINDPALSL